MILMNEHNLFNSAVNLEIGVAVLFAVQLASAWQILLVFAKEVPPKEDREGHDQ